MRSFSSIDNKRIPLDFKLDNIFNKTNGFFIELGANNGLEQSNTAYFEFFKGWKGILIEPCNKAFNICKQNRPISVCLNSACVSNEFNEEYTYGDFSTGHLMSSINGVRLEKKNQNNGDKRVKVKARTLENILDEHLKENTIDFLSLDTEGYELNILKGLNLNKYRPKWMLIEIYTWDLENIKTFLNNNSYKLHSNFSNYNKQDCPNWDGTHNDYLFYDSIMI